ncbi:MAG: hypothetical protein QNJ97_24905 [Myxococcota bacterium]|nr:hypothetical protein [Myxococcota bacterium]
MSGVRMRPRKQKAVFGVLVYDTDKSTIVATDSYFDGKNWERNGRNTFLYKTPNGRYFKQFLSRRENENSYIQPLELEEAITLYFQLDEEVRELEDKVGKPREKENWVSFEKAFPNTQLQDA